MKSVAQKALLVFSISLFFSAILIISLYFKTSVEIQDEIDNQPAYSNAISVDSAHLILTNKTELSPNTQQDRSLNQVNYNSSDQLSHHLKRKNSFDSSNYDKSPLANKELK